MPVSPTLAPAQCGMYITALLTHSCFCLDLRCISLLFLPTHAPAQSGDPRFQSEQLQIELTSTLRHQPVPESGKGMENALKQLAKQQQRARPPPPPPQQPPQPPHAPWPSEHEWRSPSNSATTTIDVEAMPLGEEERVLVQQASSSQPAPGAKWRARNAAATAEAAAQGGAAGMPTVDSVDASAGPSTVPFGETSASRVEGEDVAARSGSSSSSSSRSSTEVFEPTIQQASIGQQQQQQQGQAREQAGSGQQQQEQPQQEQQQRSPAGSQSVPSDSNDQMMAAPSNDTQSSSSSQSPEAAAAGSGDESDEPRPVRLAGLLKCEVKLKISLLLPYPISVVPGPLLSLGELSFANGVEQ